MKYVVAVSGGVDSVVLLDMLVREKKHELIVAHFDHGIRPESDADARFVWALAKSYGLPFEVRREELGREASEALARERRYAFLKDIARKYDARIVTAHHADDVIETIAINLMRGTGWRGLAVLNDASVERPLFAKRKSELYDYALEHKLEWVEDETNRTDAYLRNRLRRHLQHLAPETRSKLMTLWQQQREQAGEIDDEIRRLLTDKEPSRYDFIMLPEPEALELLRGLTSARLTRPQLRALLLAIKTARPGSVVTPGGGLTVRISLRSFIVETSEAML